MDKDKTIEAYQQAINRIDDYFEYSYHSSKDREKVYIIIKELTEKLVDINSTKQ